MSFHIQEDCCDNQLNNTPILTLNIDTVTNNKVYDMSVNIQSVIDNTIWYCCLEMCNSALPKDISFYPYNHIL